MLWLKILIGYCALAGLGLWLGYRSRLLWPYREGEDRWVNPLSRGQR